MRNNNEEQNPNVKETVYLSTDEHQIIIDNNVVIGTIFIDELGTVIQTNFNKDNIIKR